MLLLAAVLGDNKSGSIKVLYSPDLSERGVLNSAGRKRRAANPFDFQVRIHRLLQPSPLSSVRAYHDLETVQLPFLAQALLGWHGLILHL